VRPMVHANICVDRLLPQTFLLVLVAAPHLARLLTFAAQVIALAPLTLPPLVAPSVVRARLLCWRLGSKGTLVILTGAAHDLSGADRFTTLISTFPPSIGDPMSPLCMELILHRERRGQSRELIILRTPLGLLTHEAALRLGALFGIAAVPSAPRRVAHILARHMVRAFEVANRSSASGFTLRRTAIRTLIRLAGILGAENGTMWRLAINLAL
jgi:hypothetical protein